MDTEVADTGATPNTGGLPPRFALPLDQTLGHLLRRAQQVHTELWLAAFDGETTGPQFAVLLAIEQNGPMDQISVGQLASLDTSTGAGIILRLLRYGWIERRRDASTVAGMSSRSRAPPDRRFAI